MSVSTNKTAAKIEIFRRCFSGLPQVYGTYDPATARARQVKEPVTDQVILNHLTGKQSYGVYLLIGNRTRALAVDFDIDDIGKPAAFVDYACKYGIPAYVEPSKSKGYHVWIFFQEDGVLARKARLVAKKILSDIHSEGIEIFPKQDSLDTNVTYGNYINAPLFGSLVAKGRTVFLDMAEFATPYTDQWNFLKNVQHISEEKLDEIISENSLDGGENNRQIAPVNNGKTVQSSSSAFGLPPCARRMLAEGVSFHQRVACFRLAINLKRIGMPQDLALIILQAWAGKNQPINGKRIIIDSEIKSQTQYAYSNSYRGLGCESLPISDFCDTECPIYQHRTMKANLNE